MAVCRWLEWVVSEREKPTEENVVSAGAYACVGTSLFLAHAGPGSEDDLREGLVVSVIVEQVHASA